MFFNVFQCWCGFLVCIYYSRPTPLCRRPTLSGSLHRISMHVHIYIWSLQNIIEKNIFCSYHSHSLLSNNHCWPLFRWPTDNNNNSSLLFWGWSMKVLFKWVRISLHLTCGARTKMHNLISTSPNFASASSRPHNPSKTEKNWSKFDLAS